MNFKDEVSYDNTVFRTYVPSPEDRVDRSVKIYDGLVYIWCCNVIAKDADTSSGRFLLPTRVVQNPDDEKPAVLIRNDWQVAGKNAVYVDSILSPYATNHKDGLAALYVCAGPAL